MKNKKDNKKSKGKGWFSYIVILGVLLIPFMYSFFYLKAYWDPYGHMDDIPVAIVNEDKEVNNVSKGTDLVNALKSKNTLNISVVNKKKADTGLSNKDYYAVITIPSNFTSDLLSANTNNKTAATITYSPNQKSNYLASQIISRVVIEVEKEVRGNVSKEVVSTLNDNLNEVPRKVEKINTGLSDILNGTNKLNEGTFKLKDGTNSLNDKYNLFNNGVLEVNNGTNTLYENLKVFDMGIYKLQDGVNTMASGAEKLNELTKGVSTLKSGEDEFNGSLNTYITSVNTILNQAKSNPQILTTPILTLKNAFCTSLSGMYNEDNCAYFSNIVSSYKITDDNYTLVDLLSNFGTKLSNSSNQISLGINSLNDNSSKLVELSSGINNLKTSVDTLKQGSSKLLLGSKELMVGTNNLSINSNAVLSGINEINNGANTLSLGTDALKTGVSMAKEEVSKSISSTNSDLQKLNNLDEYTANPVNIKEKDVNKVNEYGTAFSPFFMSIALWVGSLMLFIILYYDVKDRFKKCSRNAENKLARTFCYLGLASLQAVILGILLKIGLGFNVTNYVLYFASLILVACTFESIMEFLIVNFNDIGKFIALILLVLQLAAAGGTFPIETVSTGFQKLFNFLPMKYSIDLFKESLISIENGLLSKSLTVIVLIFIILFVINVIKDLKTQKKTN